MFVYTHAHTHTHTMLLLPPRPLLILTLYTAATPAYSAVTLHRRHAQGQQRGCTRNVLIALKHRFGIRRVSAVIYAHCGD